MPTILLIIGAAILAAVIVVLIIWRIRSHRFHPDPDKLRQQRELNADLKETGFAYEIKGDYFYSLMNCWQRQVGYCRLYDEAAPLFNMIMDCEPITFSYRGKRWLIELWKGQYGITTGGEIGVYNTIREDVDTDEFKGTFYENIGNEEMLNLSFVLRRNGKVILKRSAMHWWLTGFKLGQFSDTDMLTMDAKIVFPDQGMKDAFLKALIEIGYTKKEYSSGRKTVSIHYAAPHSPQPLSRNEAAEALVQQINSNNCRLYEFTTAKYSQTLDKLEYIKAMVPELYKLFIDSLYTRGVYDAFEWIKDLGSTEAPTHPRPRCRPRRQNHIRIRLALLYVHAILAGPIRQIHGAILAGSTAAMLTTATLMIAQGGSSHEGCLDTKKTG